MANFLFSFHLLSLPLSLPPSIHNDLCGCYPHYRSLLSQKAHLVLSVLTITVTVVLLQCSLTTCFHFCPLLRTVNQEKANGSSSSGTNNSLDNSGAPSNGKNNSASVVFRKGLDEMCDACTTCTPGGSDDTENCLTTKSSDLGPGIFVPPDFVLFSFCSFSCQLHFCLLVVFRSILVFVFLF